MKEGSEKIEEGKTFAPSKTIFWVNVFIKKFVLHVGEPQKFERYRKL